MVQLYHIFALFYKTFTMFFPEDDGSKDPEMSPWIFPPSPPPYQYSWVRLPELITLETAKERIEKLDLCLAHYGVNDQSLIWIEELCTFRGLKRLDISFTNVSDINVFGTNTTITTFHARCDSIASNGIVELAANTTLTKLDLFSSLLDDEAAQVLGNPVHSKSVPLSSLTSLTITSDRLTDEGMAAIASNPRLKDFEIGGECMGQTAIAALASNTSLTKLTVYADIKDGLLLPLKNNSTLKTLRFQGDDVPL